MIETHGSAFKCHHSIISNFSSQMCIRAQLRILVAFDLIKPALNTPILSTDTEPLLDITAFFHYPVRNNIKLLVLGELLANTKSLKIRPNSVCEQFTDFENWGSCRVVA